MAKVIYNSIVFDSDLEVEYYKHLCSNKEVIDFRYHLSKPIQVTRGNTYTPDFVVMYADRIEIVETKGYNPYSKMRDDMIHQVMLSKPEHELKLWLADNYLYTNNLPIIYKKIKYLKAYGFVDWDFKNPNTIANKRKEKIDKQTVEIRDLRAYKKDCERYFGYLKKNACGVKLTKQQLKWMDEFEFDYIYNSEVAENE